MVTTGIHDVATRSDHGASTTAGAGRPRGGRGRGGGAGEGRGRGAAVDAGAGSADFTAEGAGWAWADWEAGIGRGTPWGFPRTFLIKICFRYFFLYVFPRWIQGSDLRQAMVRGWRCEDDHFEVARDTRTHTYT